MTLEQRSRILDRVFMYGIEGQNVRGVYLRGADDKTSIVITAEQPDLAYCEVRAWDADGQLAYNADIAIKHCHLAIESALERLRA